MKIRPIIVLCWFLGVFFLTSGISKSMDIRPFADLLSLYHPQIAFFSPLIVGGEITLGFLFLFLSKIRISALISIVILLIFTLIYLYGYFFYNIKDCGCFGDLIKLSPSSTVIKNIVAIGISYLIFIKYDDIQFYWLPNFRLVTALFLGIISFGVASEEIINDYRPIKYIQNTDIGATFLKKWNYHNESLIFIFRPDCDHCKLVTAGVKRLFKNNNYERIIGLYPSNTNLSVVADYKLDYEPNFNIFPIDIDSIRSVTRYYPTFVIISDGKIRLVSNSIPNPTKHE